MILRTEAQPGQQTKPVTDAGQPQPAHGSERGRMREP